MHSKIAQGKYFDTEGNIIAEEQSQNKRQRHDDEACDEDMMMRMLNF